MARASPSNNVGNFLAFNLSPHSFAAQQISYNNVLIGAKSDNSNNFKAITNLY